MDGDFRMIKSLKHRVSATRCDKQFKEKYMLCFWKQLHEYTENFLLQNLNTVRFLLPLLQIPPKSHTVVTVT